MIVLSSFVNAESEIIVSKMETGGFHTLFNNHTQQALLLERTDTFKGSAQWYLKTHAPN